MSFIAEKRRLAAAPTVAEKQRGDLKHDTAERGARRAGYVLVTVGVLLMLFSSTGGSLASIAWLVETGMREDLGLVYLLDGTSYDFAGPDAEQDLLSPDYEVLPGGDGGEVSEPGSSR